MTGARTLNELAARAAAARRGSRSSTRSGGRGPMSMAPSQLGAFTRSEPGRNHANIEFHVQPLSLDAFGEPLHAFPAITASVCNLNPTSRGTVDDRERAGRGRAADPAELSRDRGRPQVAADSLRVTRRDLRAAGAGALRAGRVEARGARTRATRSWRGWPATSRPTIFHPVGTTAMGRDGDPDAVLDPRLRVRDGRGGRDRRAPGGRRRGDAGDRQRQHQRAGADDGREGGALDRRGGVSGAPVAQCDSEQATDINYANSAPLTRWQRRLTRCPVHP